MQTGWFLWHQRNTEALKTFPELWWSDSGLLFGFPARLKHIFGLGITWEQPRVWLLVEVIIEWEGRGPAQSFMADLSVIVVFSSPPLPHWLQGSWNGGNKELNPLLLYLRERCRGRECLCLIDMRNVTKCVPCLILLPCLLYQLPWPLSRDNGCVIAGDCGYSITPREPSETHRWKQE